MLHARAQLCLLGQAGSLGPVHCCHRRNRRSEPCARRPSTRFRRRRVRVVCKATCSCSISTCLCAFALRSSPHRWRSVSVSWLICTPSSASCRCRPAQWPLLLYFCCCSSGQRCHCRSALCTPALSSSATALQWGSPPCLVLPCGPATLPLAGRFRIQPRAADGAGRGACAQRR